MKRILTLLKNDLLALVPGSSVPFNLHAILKLLLYAGFLLFLFQMIRTLPVFEKPRTPILERPI